MTFVIGIDEVATGCIAGPLTVACAVYKAGYKNPLIKDSKRFSSENARRKSYKVVIETAEYYNVVHASPQEIYNMGHGPVLQSLYTKVLEQATKDFPSSVVIIDGNNLIKGLKHPQQAMVKADNAICAVSAASIIAKVTRDNIMHELHKEYPEYEWNHNKGYGTEQHMASIKKYGICQQHRMNIQLCQDLLLAHGRYEDNP